MEIPWLSLYEKYSIYYKRAYLVDREIHTYWSIKKWYKEKFVHSPSKYDLVF